MPDLIGSLFIGSSRVRDGGLLKVVTGANPAAGTEISEAVPAGKAWQVLTARFTLVTSATVATRTVESLIDDGTSTLWRYPSRRTQAASTTLAYNAGAGVPESTEAASANYVFPLPSVILGPGYRIRTSTTSIQAGDDFSAPVLLVVEYEV